MNEQVYDEQIESQAKERVRNMQLEAELAAAAHAHAMTLTVNCQTLRDWFAGKALTGMMGVRLMKADDIMRNVDDTSTNRTTKDEIAENAYKYADAMLKERSK